MEQEKQNKDLINTTDCLESVGVFRSWKNFLFIIILLLLLGVQGSFWITELGMVEGKSADTVCKLAGVTFVPKGPLPEIEKPNVADKNDVAEPKSADEPNAIESKIKEAVKKVVPSEANTVNKPKDKEATQQKSDKFANLPVIITQQNMKWMVKVINFILVPAAVLYCLTILFSLKISLVGRLGGVSHITRAFFASLIFLILLLPWQVLFEGVFSGMMFTPSELFRGCAVGDYGSWSLITHYLRFVGYWLIIFLFFVSAQIKTIRWSRKTFQRLEVI
jgi:hypothetical protein